MFWSQTNLNKLVKIISNISVNLCKLIQKWFIEQKLHQFYFIWIINMFRYLNFQDLENTQPLSAVCIEHLASLSSFTPPH